MDEVYFISYGKHCEYGFWLVQKLGESRCSADSRLGAFPCLEPVGNLVLPATYPAAICWVGGWVECWGSTRWSSRTSPVCGRNPTSCPRPLQRWLGHCSPLPRWWDSGWGCCCGQPRSPLGRSQGSNHWFDLEPGQVWAGCSWVHGHCCPALPLPRQLASRRWGVQQGAAWLRALGCRRWGCCLCPGPHRWTGRQSRRPPWLFWRVGGPTGCLTASSRLRRVCSDAPQHALQPCHGANHGPWHVRWHAPAELWGLHWFAPYSSAMAASIIGPGAWGAWPPVNFPACRCRLPGVLGIHSDFCCWAWRNFFFGWSKSLPRRPCCPCRL